MSSFKSKEICFNTDTLLFSTVIILAVVIAMGISIIYLITKADPDQRPVPVQTSSQSVAPRQRFLRNSYTRPYRDQEVIFDTDSANKIGYIFNGSGEQFPLYQFMENREYKYFVLDDTRNGNKIDIPNPNKRDVLYDGDKVDVPEFLGEMNVKIYPIVNTIFSSRI